jgi:hypothetical protein
MICLGLSIIVLIVALFILIVLEATDRHGNHTKIIGAVSAISLLLSFTLIVIGLIDAIPSKEVSSEREYKATVIYVPKSGNGNEIDLIYIDDNGQEQKETIKCDKYTIESLNKDDTVWLSETHKVSFLFKTEFNSKYEIRPYVSDDE